MIEQSGTSDSAVDVTALQLRRHAILSTALPFPKLDWTYQDADAENLKHLRDYSESLANSVLDWYLAHQKSKKRTAQIIHFFMYFFVGLASIPPLLKVGFGNGAQNACAYGYCDWLNNHSGELALVFLGLAGVAKLWDSNAGYTVDWMRFITTATRINQELNSFQFEWEKIDLAVRDRPGQTEGAADPEAMRPPKMEACPHCGFSHPVEKLAPTERKLRLAEAFCAQIFKIVGGEITAWADELKKRYDKVTGHAGTQDR
jgi:hypothetical protein